MAWCCTEGTRAYVGERPVIESMAEELQDHRFRGVRRTPATPGQLTLSIGSGEPLLSSPF